jgi:hypothetical protein
MNERGSLAGRSAVGTKSDVLDACFRLCRQICTQRVNSHVVRALESQPQEHKVRGSRRIVQPAPVPLGSCCCAKAVV